VAASENPTVVAALRALKTVATPIKCSPGWPAATAAAMPPYTSVFRAITAMSASASSHGARPRRSKKISMALLEPMTVPLMMPIGTEIKKECTPVGPVAMAKTTP
jgi:hypothetical protein